MSGLGLTVASGLLYPLAFPSWSWWPVGWVCVVPLLVALRRTSGVGRRAGLAVLWTSVWCASVVDWLPATLSAYYNRPPWVGYACAAGIVLATGGVQYALFAVLVPRLAAGRVATRSLVVAAGWVVAEYLRDAAGNPWVLIGYSQTPVLPLLQIAEVTGVYGVSFVVVAVNAAIAELWLARGTAVGRAAGPACGVALALVLLVLGYGHARLAASVQAEPGVRVGVVQSNVDVMSQWNRREALANLDLHLELTRQLVERQPDTALIVWPESAITFYVQRDPVPSRRIHTVLGDHPTELIAGAPRANRDGSMFNSAVLFGHEGTILGWQDKRFPIPFVEYFPFGVGLLQRRFNEANETARGEWVAPLKTAVGRVGVLTCNESLFPSAAADLVRDGASLLVNVANDTWHGGGKYALEAFEVTKLRAIEQRRYVVRASTSGPSGIVDPWGRTVVGTKAFGTDATAGDVGVFAHLSYYARASDAFSWCCMALVMVAVCVARST